MFPDQPVLRVRLALPAPSVLRALPVRLDPLDRKVLPVHKDRRVKPGLLVRKVLPVHKDRRVKPDPLDRKVLPVHKDRKVLRVRPGLPALCWALPISTP